MLIGPNARTFSKDAIIGYGRDDGLPRAYLGGNELGRIKLSERALTTPGTRWYPLGHVLGYPALYAAYPELLIYPVKIEVLSQHRTPEKNPADVTPNRVRITSAPPYNRDRFLTFLKHEVQHIIQMREGFSVSSNIDLLKVNWSDQISTLQRAKEMARTHTEARLAKGSRTDPIGRIDKRLHELRAQVKRLTHHSSYYAAKDFTYSCQLAKRREGKYWKEAQSEREAIFSSAFLPLITAMNLGHPQPDFLALSKEATRPVLPTNEDVIKAFKNLVVQEQRRSLILGSAKVINLPVNIFNHLTGRAAPLWLDRTPFISPPVTSPPTKLLFGFRLAPRPSSP